MPEKSTAGKPATILAFDFGRRRIGLAVGQTITASASPLGVIQNGERGADFARIEALLREWRPDLLVLGLPLHADGSPSEMSSAVQAFKRQLEDYGLPVILVDEQHSSREAGQVLKDSRQAGRRGRIQKQDIDAAAAVLIAERYLQMPQTELGSG
ncbi:MAG TPA: Holliday junction resolvase RuvX [Woeseiaceae bacterium]|nr:Holliday junction resolvase RuvX [Woeseiaceae bacterium]